MLIGFICNLAKTLVGEAAADTVRQEAVHEGRGWLANWLLPLAQGVGQLEDGDSKQDDRREIFEQDAGEEEENVDGEDKGEEESDDTDSTASDGSNNVQEAATSFKNMLFKSEEVKDAIKTHFAMDQSKKKIRTQTYDSKSLFPAWMLNDPAWTNSNADTTGIHISQILQKSPKGP